MPALQAPRWRKHARRQHLRITGHHADSGLAEPDLYRHTVAGNQDRNRCVVSGQRSPDHHGCL